MDHSKMKRIFIDTDFVHTSGTPEELKVAQYLKACCEELGVRAWIESFPVPMAEMESCEVLADGRSVPCKGFYCSGSGTVEGELYYMTGSDPVSIEAARDKIVLMHQPGVNPFLYKDLMKVGVKAILFRCGNLNYPNTDIDQRDLRAKVVGEERKVPCAMIHVSDAVELVKNKVKNIRISISQKEYEGASHNVVAEIPGRRDEFIALSAHYDTTSLSHGSYDNMSGCVGLLNVMEALREKNLNYGLRFVFCGSEERGLLGSKAYAGEHEAELEKIALNINLDMIGTIMGKFIACASSEDRLAHYVSYMGAELGFPVESKTGVYSSDSTSFADKGVPAISFARMAGDNIAPIHCRYDTMDVLSMEQMEADSAFITEFTRRMADAAVCPVKREIPESIRKELDEYLYIKKKEN